MTSKKDQNVENVAGNEEKPLAEWVYPWLMKELTLAYQAARKGKRHTLDEHQFELNATENLMLLEKDILERCFHPSRGIAFIIKKPVIREIFAAPFRDRVIHHFLYNQCYEWWDRRLIPDSYSCRVGKGTLYGARRLKRMIRRETQNYTRTAYVIKLDVQGYFMSLPRHGLYQRICWGLEKQYPNKGPIYEICKFLWREVIFDDPTWSVRRRGPESDWKDLPLSKSLFTQPLGRGIVIGNLSSQLLSNIYLDLLDRFVTQQLGYRSYGRYVDDFFIVVPEEKLEQALRDVALIEEYLKSIGLVLHPRKRYVQDTRHGVAFLGTVIYHGKMVPGKRLKHNFCEAVELCAMGRKDVDSVVSYLGTLKHLDSTNLKVKAFDHVGWDYQI